MQKIGKKGVVLFVLGIIFAVIILAQFVIMAILNGKIDQSTQQLQTVSTKNEQLESDIEYLRDPDTQKEYARQKMGYADPDEQIFVGE